MGKIRISAVRYANTYPFIYGLKESGFDRKAIIETDHPSECARKLIEDRADLGLIPVGALPLLKEYHIIGNYCIGADGNVRTVMLFSNSSFDEIRRVYLDYRSRTSVRLVRVLAMNYWKKDFEWVNTSESFSFTSLKKGEAAVLIGDQCFENENSFSKGWDLAGEWKKFTGMPFVFACWASNKKLDESFTAEFNEALSAGVNNINAVVVKFGNEGPIRNGDLQRYLTENIDFNLDERKREAIRLFLELNSRL